MSYVRGVRKGVSNGRGGRVKGEKEEVLEGREKKSELWREGRKRGSFGGKGEKEGVLEGREKKSELWREGRKRGSFGRAWRKRASFGRGGIEKG